MSNQQRSATPPSLPKGTRDFGPEVMDRRTYILDTIKRVFRRYGFQPLETPSMEKLSVLTGKYGDEGDQLLFKVLDNGDFYSSIDPIFKLSNSEAALLAYTIGEIIDVLYDDPKTRELISNLDEGSNRGQLENHVKDYVKGRNSDQKLSGFYSILSDKKSIKTIVTYAAALSTSFYNSGIVKDGHIDKNELASEKKKMIWKDIIPQLDMLHSSKHSSQSISNYITPQISGKGLRYDLTVPFARYVVMNQHAITFPFRRYQVQPVWRADRPQKGRYREFYQCDADVVGTDSLTCEAEIVMMLEDVFSQLHLTDYTIKVNDRRLLHGLVEVLDVAGKETDLLVAIEIGRAHV